MALHYHTGHGLTGHGPEDRGTCETLACLSSCVRTDLDFIAEQWGDQAHGERTHVENLRRERPTSGADPVGYPGSWESIATAALRALECLDNAETAGTLAFDLRPERARAPLYADNPDAWQAELRRLLLDSGTYPLVTTLDGNVRFYVWDCAGWECRLSEFDAGYTIPAACRSDGGIVPCACRDCMDVAMFTPGSGEAPYCDACVSAGCADRLHGECDVDPDGDE